MAHMIKIDQKYNPYLARIFSNSVIFELVKGKESKYIPEILSISGFYSLLDKRLKVKELFDEEVNAGEVKNGVVVSNIKPASQASGILRHGDIIVEVNKEKIESVSQFEKKITQFKKGQQILLLVPFLDSRPKVNKSGFHRPQ